MKSEERAPQRIAVALLTLSLAATLAWDREEGFTETPVIPTKGDVPTIGHGSTRYEDGTPVRMTDAPITRQRAAELSRNLHGEEARRFRASIPGAYLTQGEFDLYLDFTGQYGITNWRSSSMRRHILTGEYRQACSALLAWRKAAGYDCSTLINGKPNKRCWGVWERQLKRHAACMAEQGQA